MSDPANAPAAADGSNPLAAYAAILPQTLGADLLGTFFGLMYVLSSLISICLLIYLLCKIVRFECAPVVSVLPSVLYRCIIHSDSGERQEI